MRSAVHRLGLFNAVAAAGFAVQITMLAWLTRAIEWHPVPATAVAMELVIIQNYLAHSRWTWSDRPARTRRVRLIRALRYQGAKTISLVLNVALTSMLISRGHLAPEVANVLAVAICAIWNYTAADRFVFTEARPRCL